MIFSIDTIKQSLNQEFPTIVSEDNEYDISFFDVTLNMLMQEQREFETNITAINEFTISFSTDGKFKLAALDFNSILEKIFTWFIQAIEKLYQMFVVAMTKLLNKETRIRLFKSKLSSFNGYINYNKNYFDYTNIFNESSYTTYQSEISREYDDLTQKLISINSCNTPMELADTLAEIKNDISYDGEYLDEVRGKLLGFPNPVPAEDFSKRLFRYFRNDRSEPHNPGTGFAAKPLDSAAVMDAYNGYFSYNKQERIIEKDFRNLTSQANYYKSKLKSAAKNSGNKNLNVVKEYNEIVNIKCRKIKDICDIYRMYYSAKLDAIKECNMKNISILNAAIDEIVKEEVKHNGNK